MPDLPEHVRLLPFRLNIGYAPMRGQDRDSLRRLLGTLNVTIWEGRGADAPDLPNILLQVGSFRRPPVIGISVTEHEFAVGVFLPRWIASLGGNLRTSVQPVATRGWATQRGRSIILDM